MQNTPSARSNLHGALAMLAAVGCFSLMDALLKTLSSSYPPMQVAALRGLGALPLVVAYVLWRGQGRKLFKVRWPLHLLRGVLVVAMLGLFTFGLQTLGLAEAYTLFFIAPMLIAVLSGPVLREKVRPAHWIALAVGAVGVLVALRPDERALLSLGGLAVLAAALMYAVSAVVGRVLTRTDASATIVFWTTTMLALGAGALALPGWMAVAPEHWPLVLGLAVTGFLGQTAITEAFRHGQASVIAPLEYTALAWGIGLDWVLWQALPEAATLVGGGIVIAGGIYLLRSERRRRRDMADVDAPT